VPEYLIPPLIKEHRKRREEQLAAATGKAQGNSKKVRVLVHSQNKGFEKSLKRRMEANNLALDDVKKKIKVDGDQYVTLDTEHEEDPTLVDATRLKITSSRKLWKLKHGYKLKKRNRKLEKKGIFTS
jgi:ATP-dependent RNA helicase DDX56/DBP9